MRTGLKPLADKSRNTFKATFCKFGRKDGFKGYLAVTALLVNVTDTEGKPLTDHLWMTCRKRLSGLDLKPGDIIQFDARVGTYQKGYSEYDEENPFRIDYRLEFPSKISKIGTDATYSIWAEKSDRIRKELEDHNARLHESRVAYIMGAGKVAQEPAIEKKEEVKAPRNEERTTQKRLDCYL